MRHWSVHKWAREKRRVALGFGACVAFWGLASSAGTSLGSAVLRQTATFDNPFSNDASAVTATTTHDRQPVEPENPYTRKKGEPFHPFELEARESGAPHVEIIEISRNAVKHKAARLDPENPFERRRATITLVPKLENPFEGKPKFDYERALPLPKRNPSPLKLDEDAY